MYSENYMGSYLGYNASTGTGVSGSVSTALMSGVIVQNPSRSITLPPLPSTMGDVRVGAYACYK